MSADLTKEQAKAARPKMKRGLYFQQAAILVAFLVLCGTLSVLSPAFLTLSNIINILRQNSFNLLLSLGVTMVILAGGIDLSIASVAALASCVCATVMMAKGVPLGVFAGLAVGLAAGFVNGALITNLRLPPLVGTLGTDAMFRGFALLVTGGNVIFGLPQSFMFLGRGLAWGMPIPVIIAAVALVIGHFVLSQTRLGVEIYATGGNRDAAHLSGIHVKRISSITYLISGFLAGLVGVLMTARLASAQPTLGAGWGLEAIASVVIGGTSLRGGEGNLVGTIIGVFMIGVLSNGLNVLNVNYFWQQVAIGTIIVLAVASDTVRRRE